jgi:hypothetical protein
MGFFPFGPDTSCYEFSTIRNSHATASRQCKKGKQSCLAKENGSLRQRYGIHKGVTTGSCGVMHHTICFLSILKGASHSTQTRWKLPSFLQSFQMQNRCAEIKIRAERRAGELLRGMEETRGGDHKSENFKNQNSTDRSGDTIHNPLIPALLLAFAMQTLTSSPISPLPPYRTSSCQWP